ncbi:MAG: transporter substrate-binding domain-containing protein [Halieaceae bacterium]|nr:transporter substrate-binding domain-containing protein [Halieaceae bacterium]
MRTRGFRAILGRILAMAAIVLTSQAMAQSVVTASGDIEDRTLDDVIDSGFIEIGVYRDFAPFSFSDEDGSPRGVDVAVGRLIAEGLGVEPRWLWMTPDETTEDDLRNYVWKGSLFDRKVADVMLRVPYDRDYSYAIDGYGLPKHENVVMFGPYHAESWAIARDLEQTGDVRNLAIFRFQKIGVETDSLPDMFLSGAFGGQLRSNLIHYLQIREAADALKSGELSAVAGMRSQLEWFLRDRPGRYDIDDDGLQAFGRLSWDIGAAVKHTHRQLAYAIEDVIAAAVRDGRMEKLFAEHGLPYGKPSLYTEVEGAAGAP